MKNKSAVIEWCKKNNIQPEAWFELEEALTPPPRKSILEKFKTFHEEASSQVDFEYGAYLFIWLITVVSFIASWVVLSFLFSKGILAVTVIIMLLLCIAAGALASSVVNAIT